MPTTYDLGPAAAQVAHLARTTTDEQLDAATPCAEWPVRTLVEHLLGLSAAFTAAATKTPSPARPPDASLPADWRNLLRHRLDALVAAWRAPEAWEGEAQAGGVTMPADLTGVVALDELVLHGWDPARATGRGFDADPTSVQACLGFAAAMSEPGQEAGREGLYEPVVTVERDASDFDRLLGFAGRDPRWTPERAMPRT